MSLTGIVLSGGKRLYLDGSLLSRTCCVSDAQEDARRARAEAMAECGWDNSWTKLGYL
jgi:hypothetical protein